MQQERELIETLRKVEALFADTGFDGERSAASVAIERIKERLARAQKSEDPVEYQFGGNDRWSTKLLVAVLRRYGIQAYRYPRQRYTTVMARVPVRFVNETLWPEYIKLSEVLTKYLDEVTDRVIREGIHPDDSEAEVRQAPAKLPSPK